MIAVFGATGKVGGKVAAMLLERGIPVRILVHTGDNATPLKNEGAEIVEGDLRNIEDVKRTFDRCDGAFLVTPLNVKSEQPAEDEITIGRNYADALRDATVRHAVYLSIAGARSSTGIPHYESKAVVESMLASVDVDVTFMRPSFFMENVFNQAPLIKDYGMIALPLAPDTPVPMVATEDVAYAVTESLVRGGRGCEQYEMYGPENYTPERVTSTLSKILEKDIRYHQASPDETRQFLKQIMGASDPFIDGMLRMFESLRTMWRDWTPEMEEARWRVYNDFNFEPTTIETVFSTVSQAVRSETSA